MSHTPSLKVPPDIVFCIVFSILYCTLVGVGAKVPIKKSIDVFTFEQWWGNAGEEDQEGNG